MDGDARLAWRGASVTLADSRSPRLEDARFCVFDLETTGLATASARICEIGAVRVERLALADTFQTLVRPGVPLPRPVGALTGLAEAELARAPRVGPALRRFAAFAGEAVLVAHNARFDTAFVNRELERLTGKRHAGPVVDTVSLARNLLRGRVELGVQGTLGGGVSLDAGYTYLDSRDVATSLRLQRRPAQLPGRLDDGAVRVGGVDTDGRSGALVGR